ncbi:MAG TPA: CAP domain-containing protein [Rhizomicrobium sp.]|jgi:uncharacterized protein YkwD|nr:CAP domain-containing protein [Rhizomicrobium sp.]
MKQAAFLVLILLAPLALPGCEGITGLGAPAALTPPDPRSQMTALEARIAALIEEQRLKLDPNAKPLTLDPELAHIARLRASDMAAKNYLAHAGPNGDTSATLLMTEDAKFQGLLGENLAAQHYAKQSGVDVEEFAQRFLDEWMKSQPHRENLAFADYDRTGVGAAVNADTVYVTQLFASNLGTIEGRSPSGGATAFHNPEAARAASTVPADATATPPLRLRGTEGGGAK